MRTDPAITELLNDVLTAELTAVNQYFVHAKLHENWGFAKLAEKIRETSIDEMRHAEKLMDRILYLEASPNLQRLNPVRVGEDAVEALRLDLEVEHEAIARLNEAIAKAVELGDNGTRELLAELLLGEEADADWLETQLHLIDTVGAERYLAEQL